MNEERKNIINQIHNTSIEDIKNNEPKKSKWQVVKEVLIEVGKELIIAPIRFVGALFGVTGESIESHGTTSNHGGSGSPSTQSHSSGNTFKDSISFDPSKAYMERIQEQAYFKMIDGKGDHDCDHEH